MEPITAIADAAENAAILNGKPLPNGDYHVKEDSPEAPEELQRAVANMRDNQFADFLTFALCLAAEKNPEQLRTAFAKVLGVEDIEARCARAVKVACAAEERAGRAQIKMYGYIDEINSLIQEYDKRLGQLQRDIAKASGQLKATHERIDKAGKYLDGLAKTVAPAKK